MDKLVKAVFLEMFGDPIENPKNWQKKELKVVSPIIPAQKENEFISSWLLNLDQIEPDIGIVLNKKIVEKGKIGNSTNWFDENYVLYSKLRPYLNKVVIPDEKGICTSELLPLKPNKDELNKVFLAHAILHLSNGRMKKQQGQKCQDFLQKICWLIKLFFPH